MNTTTITFDQLPNAVQQLMNEVRLLNQKVDKIAEGSFQMQSRDKHRVIHADEVCKIIKKTRNTLYSMTSRGEIPSYKQGKYLYFFEDEILEWMKSHRQKDTTDIMRKAEEYVQRNRL